MYFLFSEMANEEEIREAEAEEEAENNVPTKTGKEEE
jgi:hypothetical protein